MWETVLLFKCIVYVFNLLEQIITNLNFNEKSNFKNKAYNKRVFCMKYMSIVIGMTEHFNSDSSIHMTFETLSLHKT